MIYHRFLNKKVLIVLAIIGLLLLLGGIAFLLFFQDSPIGEKKVSKKPAENTSTKDNKIRALGGGDCKGEGPVDLTHLPMNEEDFSSIEPYGLMTGSHVTPIDHWYFSPAIWKSPIDAYPVYAMADGAITSIGRRKFDNSHSGKKEEFRLVFTHSCTFLTYYDLVTILNKEITNQAKELSTKDNVSVNIPVKAGQEIGRIGGQTLDFAVWDTEKTLTGFINPESYKAEPWKIYTANPYDYVTDELKKVLIEKNLRTKEPLEGKIDYDIKGKLVGNWFLEGTNGYAGGEEVGGENYWKGHMSIAYHHIDPSAIIVSIGDWQGKSEQFAAVANKPDPAKVDTSTGVVKYELGQIDFFTSSGELWDRQTLVKPLTVKSQNVVLGTVIFQVMEGDKLKMEIFPGKTASQVSGFSGEERIYER